MSRREEYEAKTEALLQPMVDERGFELVDVEYVKEGSNWYLRAFIDKPGGISIDDIEPISRELSEKLDQEDFISDAYILEVSSPGLGRPLKKDKDFVRSIGEEIEIHLYRAINKQKEFVGILKEFNKEENTFTVELEDGEETVFNRADVALVRLTFDF
ncbi:MULTISPECIES: ribosome maturation factor RimP [Eubacterium]|uniref:Ribosome maturation factor RimP n=1 Tax=Eubacterium album TaxID=2978477 RepID=A0ABT2LX80_9FIRM|nr:MULTISPECIES: ribosome maturation factor RimP [unclassified Eubacterium (in: firmicutes)]MCJ7967106.1 ribosome maturation factor RimP [Lachnospiraceae bacterium NSJ-171]MEE0293514.1 ribosome maturation factor RimP [Eubacterium sp.]CDA29112.1 ribosome maturation factor RimP [Eubacterium sp. CAG:156]MCT7397889.1 ribosome maturation factor RimP [Eubacterium sp. LFL-14]RGG65898.1 ribosome maturation factor RimP [Eubacterium sp. AF17-7]